MDKFESWVDAMRRVKELIGHLDLHDEVFFGYDEYGECYFVTDSENSIEDLIHQDWLDSACELDPEEQANGFKVFVYMSGEHAKRWPILHKKSKKSLLSTEREVYRKKVDIHPEHSVSFNISKY